MSPEPPEAGERAAVPPSPPSDPPFLSLNDVQPDLIAAAALLTGEPSAAFLDTLHDHLARFGPVDGVAVAYIEEACIYYWWQRRGWHIHKILFEDAMVDYKEELPTTIRITFAFRDLVKTQVLRAWIHYDAHLSRQYHRAINDLVRLQTSRFPNVPLQPGPAPAPSARN